MTIGKPRWGGLRPDPYNPDSPDADNDGIVQEGTLFERPAGTRIVSALTGLELDLGTPGNSLQDVSDTRIVDREGRPVNYRQSWSSGTLSAGERNGTIGNSNGTVGDSLGTLDGPPPAPKPDAIQLRSTDVDKNGKPLRVFVADDRRFHGVMPTDWAGFENPAWREVDAHWGGSLRDGEMPISPNDPRLPDTLYYDSGNPSAQRDLGVVRADGDTGRADFNFTLRPRAERPLDDERPLIWFGPESTGRSRDVPARDVPLAIPEPDEDLTPSIPGQPLDDVEMPLWFGPESFRPSRDVPARDVPLTIPEPDEDLTPSISEEAFRPVHREKYMGVEGVLPVRTDSIRTGAAVTLRGDQVSVYGDIRLDADAAPEPRRREVDIPTPDSLDPIKDRFDAEGFELYLVGGAVRDTLMGREIKDYDLASDATPDQIEAMLADVDGARLDLTGKDFAVVRVNMPDGEEYEIATFRRDVGEGRRPDEVEFTTIDEDVRRRDLTMNALFYDLSTGEIVDYVGGMDDIENGVVRAVGDPSERFREDPLRILRAFRFSGRTGWGMDSATVDAIRANSALRGVSGERVHEEFVRGIDSAVSPAGYIQQIDIVDNGTGAVWGQIFPGLNVSPSRLPADGSYNNRSVLVASLLADNDIDNVKSVLKDRKFTNDEIADVELIMQARSINDGNVATLKNKFGKNDRVSADDMRAFHSVQPETEDEIEPFLQFADAAPALTANDLQEQGIKPGPQFGAILREAEEQRYREIRDGFSVGGDKPAPARPAPVNANRDQRSFKDADDRIDAAAADAPEIASDPTKVQESLAPRPGEESPGYAFRPVDQLQNLKVKAEDELASFLADPETTPERLEQYRDWVEASQAHIASLDEAISAEGGWATIAIEQFDDGAPDSITAVMESDSFKKRIDDILLEIDPKFRPSSVAISPVDAEGNTVAEHMGFYYHKEDTVYIHPSMLATVFRDEGVSFEDYAKWANVRDVWVNPANPTGETRGPKPRLDELREFALEVDLASAGLLPDGVDLSGSGRLSRKEQAEQRDLLEGALRQYLAERPYRDVWDSPNKAQDDQAATLLRETLLHESFHGVHFRVDGDMNTPEYIEVRDKVIKAIQDSDLFEELIQDNPAEYGRPDNYFQYTMMWLGLGGDPAKQDRQNFLDNMAPEYRELLEYYQGGELFAEALTHAMLGRKFPGSDIILEHITRER